MPVSQIVAVAMAIAGVVVALLLLIKGARGRPLVLGIIGTVAILLGLLGRFAFQWLAERFAGRGFNDTIVSILAADAVLSALLTGGGLLVMTRAFVVAGWPEWTGTLGKGKPNGRSAPR